MVSGKVWGTTEAILDTPFVSVHRLHIAPNSYCSLHAHEYRWNAFLMIRGKLFVEVHQKSYALVDVTELSAGDCTAVAPGLQHRFRTGDEAVECYEIYYPAELNAGDIIRQDVGGRNV